MSIDDPRFRGFVVPEEYVFEPWRREEEIDDVFATRQKLQQRSDAPGQQQDDTLVFSTDYPHSDSHFPEATNIFLKLPLSEASKKKILWDNCARLYRL